MAILRNILCFILLPFGALALPPVQELNADRPVWMVQDHTVPVISVRLTFEGVGSAYDPADKQGLANIVSSMLEEGSGGMSAAAFQAYLNRHAIQLSASAGKENLTVTYYGLREHAAEGFRALAQMLMQPNLEPAALERVRAQHLAGLALAKQSPSYYAGRLMAETLYEGHPYAQSSRGTEATLAAITLHDVQTYLASAIQQDRLRVTAAGALRSEELEEWLDLLLADMPDAEVEALPLPTLPEISTSRTEHSAMENPQSQILFAVPGVKRDDPDFFAAFVFAHVLGGNGLTSILAEELRQERGLTYGAYSWLDSRKEGGVLQGSFATATATRSEAIGVLHATLNEVYEKGVTQAQRDQAVAYITGAFPLALDSTGGLTKYLQIMQRYALGTDYLERRNHYFEAVTLEDVNRVAKRLLDPAKRIVVWAGKATAPTKIETQESTDE